MKLSKFKFKLAENQIALYPSEHRDESRLMVVHKKTGEIEHKIFKEIIDYFDENDVLVFNDTQVFPARLYGNKEKTGAKIEVLKWKSDSFKEYAWISAYGVHPQTLENVDFGENVKDFNSVEYKNNKPYFSLKIEDFIENKQIKSEKNPGERSHSAEELKEIQSVIRNTLNLYNLQLLSEKMQPYSISFTCKEYKEIDKTNFLMAINELSEKWNIKISELVLESAVEESSGNSFFGQITFDFNENFNSGINLNSLAIRPSLILYKNKVAAQRPVNNQNNFVQKKSKNNKEKILGQITHADGSVIIYYKNSEGKVLWEKKKAY